MFPEEPQLIAVRSGGGDRGIPLAFVIAFEAKM